MCRILICDDQRVVREGLSAILSTIPGFSVTALAANGAEALEYAAQDPPNLVLMDLKMPVLNGVQATRKLKERFPGLPVLILTTFADDEWLFDAIRAGAAGYLLKDTGREDLEKAIRGTLAGRSFIDPALAGKLFRKIADPQAGALPSGPELTDREREILGLIVAGRTNPQIARELYLAPGTVRNYVSTLLQKLEVEDRTRAAVEAVRRGLVPPARGEGPPGDGRNRGV